MSNPTELPDLDTVIAFLLGEGPLLGQHFGDKRPESTTYWWRDYLRSAARRAQPEGEAPQAEPFMFAISTPDGKAHFDEHCVDTTAEALEAEAQFASIASGLIYRVVPVYLHATPAAQHAESGAPAALEQAAALVVKMTAPPRDLMGTPTVAMKTTANLGQRIATAIRALTPGLAAQSQGAPAAPAADELARMSQIASSVEGIAQPYAGAISLLETIASFGANSPARDLQMRAACQEFAGKLRAALAAKAEAAALTPLDYRAQGREEALAIILAESAEDPFSECTGWSKSGAPDDEGGAYWKEGELRALLHIDDRKHDAYDRAEAAYWEALGRKGEAARELLFAQQAPFYKPLHDFLSKHEAWDLMADLKRAQQAAAPGALDAYEMTRLRRLMKALGQEDAFERDDEHVRGSLCTVLGIAAGRIERAPGTPEAPTDLNAQRWLWVQENIRDGYELPGGFYLPDHDTSTWDRTVDAARAAQLDGCQGEGK